MNDEYSNIMDQAEGSLYSRRGEASSITSSVLSKVKRLQLDEMCNMEMEQKKAEIGNNKSCAWSKIPDRARKIRYRDGNRKCAIVHFATDY